jgi:putative ABC transport system ATP-binding protein/lipoprotein-releasing system ATP-binding protein
LLVASPEIVLLRGAGVSRRFERAGAGVAAVAEVSFEIDADSRIALVGPSGSGKSTLLHLMAGLLDPSAGSVSWPALDKAGDGRPGTIAVVFQAPSLVPWLDAVENVMVPLLLQGLDATAARGQAEAALAALGLAEIGDKLPEELSGGEAQRVAVARAMAQKAKLMLADEPTGQLDQANASEVMSALVHAADRNRAALIVATHDPAVAAALSVVWRMDHGYLEVAGSAVV